jgi:alkylated DNA repair dioxygenase AlkB
MEALELEEGDLLLMQPAFQHAWVHRVPVEPEVAAGRINLTFRRVVGRQEYAGRN